MIEVQSTELPLNEHLKLLLKVDNVPCDETTDKHSHPDHHEVPPWFDELKFKRGQQFYFNNLFSLFISKLCGLLCVIAVPSILKILIFTKQSSSVETAYRRYVATILHMHSWYANDFHPGSKMWTSLIEIRQKHHSASNRSSKASMGQITQVDMALTQFGFVGFALSRPKMLGIKYTEDDLEGFVHFWRVIGWILGVDDKYNLCRESVDETKELCDQLIIKYFAQNLRSTDKDFVFMCDKLLRGMWYVNPLIYVNSFKAFTFRLTDYIEFKMQTSQSLGSIQLLDTPKLVLTGYEQYIFDTFIHLLSNLFDYTFVRMYFNAQIRVTVFLLAYFPFLAFFSFGIQNSYVNVYY